jgi:hypothetical protein
MMTRRRYYFVFRLGPERTYDLRLPDGGITVRAASEEAAQQEAYRIAEQRFPRKPRELIVVMERHGQMQKRQAKLMEASWKSALRSFKELMTAQR